MSVTSSSHLLNHESTSTIGHIVFKSSRAFIIESKGDGFGSHIERLINVAHDTHRSFPNLLKTLNDFINYLREEIERSYYPYQFSMIIGKNFDYDYQNLSNYLALIEHTGMKILIFSSIGTSFKQTTTNDINDDDDKKPLLW